LANGASLVLTGVEVSKNFKTANWRTCAEVEPQELHWLWCGKIPLRHLTMFAGDPSLGKTLMAIECMARGSRGEDFIDGGKNDAGVFETIFLCAEDDPATIIVPRLMAANADLSKIHLVDSVMVADDERLLTLDRDLVVIREKLEENPRIKLLVIDPLSNYLGTADLNKEQEVRSVLTPLIRMAQEFDIAIVVIAHHSKQANRNAMHKVIGAVGAVGAGRMGWSFVKSPEDENTREMLLMKENLGKFPGIRYTTESVEITIKRHGTQQGRIKFLCESSIPIENVIASADDHECRRDKPALSFIKNNLPRDAEVLCQSLIDQAETVGISKAKLFRARKTLDIKSFKKGDAWYWKWPTEGDN
jgi:putative DNA primase/helicase